MVRAHLDIIVITVPQHVQHAQLVPMHQQQVALLVHPVLLVCIAVLQEAQPVPIAQLDNTVVLVQHHVQIVQLEHIIRLLGNHHVYHALLVQATRLLLKLFKLLVLTALLDITAHHLEHRPALYVQQVHIKHQLV